MLSEICKEVRNYFCQRDDKHLGSFEISGGSLTPPPDFLQLGQYYRIVGSVFNDGVHKFGAADLTEEKFTGAIWAMRVPADFLALVDEIKAFNESDAGKASPYTSESFGGYSYTRATSESGAPLSWQQQFAGRLNKYRRARE